MEEQAVSEGQEHFKPYPHVSIRFRAVFYDSLFIIVLIFLITFIISFSENVSDTVRLNCFIGLGLYDPLFTCVLGFTPGQRIMGIAVRKAKNENTKINFFAALIRSFTKGMLGIISFFTVSSKNRGRAIHDMIAGSVVVYAD